MTLSGVKCTNWDYMDSFGVRLYSKRLSHFNSMRRNYTNFYRYSPVWLDQDDLRWHQNHVTNYNRSVTDEKGFLFQNELFERYESIGVTWNDNFCRRIKKDGPAGCFVQREVETYLIADFNYPENNCSGYG